MVSRTLLVFLLGSLSCAAAESFEDAGDVGRPYEKDKVFKISPGEPRHVAIIEQLRDSLDLDFWSEPIPGHLHPVVVRVPGAATDHFERNLTYHKIPMSLSPVNVSDQVRREFASNSFNFPAHVIHKRAMLTSNLTRPTDGPNVVGAFPSYNAVTLWMDQMCRHHPSVATCLTIGKSFEGRILKLMKIGFPGNRDKKSIFLDANIHAREWLSGAAAIWLMNKLLSSYRNDGTVFDLLTKVDVYVFPIANPDGYEYSRRPARRYWRKTRSRTNRPACFGADPNRNFAFQWGTNGASTNPCSEVYQGPAPFSEPETKAMSDFIRTRRRNMVAYFALHSYGNYWLIPWGFSGASKPADFDEMLRVARLGMTAISRRSRQKWHVGNTVDLLYPAAGGSDDWAKSMDIKYSYTLELRPSSEDPQFGFVVESTEIEPTGIDLWTGINTAVRAIFAAPYRSRVTRYKLRRLASNRLRNL